MLKTGFHGLKSVVFLLILLLSACGGGGSGGGGSTPPPALPNLGSSATSYDFGDVTVTNSPAPKQFVLTNLGNAPLAISNIAVSGTDFGLDLNSANDFCGSSAPTIAAGGNCTVAVSFAPSTVGGYSGTLTVHSNDPTTPWLYISLAGNGTAVANHLVKINQVKADACPTTLLTAYISVTDQVGYPIPNLTASNFSVSETANSLTSPMSIQALESVDTVTTPISVALVMDYSTSVTDNPELQQAMEDGVISFIKQLGVSDEAEIIKFDTEFEVVQPFTAGNATGQAALIAKVVEPWDMGPYSRVHDAVKKAITDTAARQSGRHAVIVLSDFFDNPGTGYPSETTQAEVFDYAKAEDVPIYIVGMDAGVKSNELTVLANATGGQYFDVSNTGNLRTIYLQQAQTLFVDQYVLSYSTDFITGDSATLTVGVKLDGQLDYVYDSRIVVPCP